MSEHIKLFTEPENAINQLRHAKPGESFISAGWGARDLATIVATALNKRKNNDVVFKLQEQGEDTVITVSGVTTKVIDGTVTFPTGAVRSTDSDDVRYDLIPPEALRRIAARYSMGAAKYGDNNWQKGIPVGNIVNHLQNHLERWKTEGCISDDNLAGAAWGLFTLMWYEKHKPELLKEAGVPVD